MVAYLAPEQWLQGVSLPLAECLAEAWASKVPFRLVQRLVAESLPEVELSPPALPLSQLPVQTIPSVLPGCAAARLSYLLARLAVIAEQLSSQVELQRRLEMALLLALMAEACRPVPSVPSFRLQPGQLLPHHKDVRLRSCRTVRIHHTNRSRCSYPQRSSNRRRNIRCTDPSHNTRGRMNSRDSNLHTSGRRARADTQSGR
jgi:hypothetical protein